MLSDSVSVIVPTYNRAQTIVRCLDSVIQQSYLPKYFEIIVVDDGSNDDTQKILRYYQHIHGIRVLQQSNQGVSNARNLGIKSAKFDWIAFLDSDDYWMPHKLHQQMRKVLSEETLVCHTEEIWIRNGKRVNQCKHHKKNGGFTFTDNLPLCAMSPSSIIIHRNVFDVVGVFDESLPACEDYDLWLRITAIFKVSYVSDPCIYKTGGHADQLSRRFVAMDRFRISALVKILKSGILDSYQTEQTKNMLVKKATIYLKGCLKHRQPFQISLRELDQLELGTEWNQLLTHLQTTDPSQDIHKTHDS